MKLYNHIFHGMISYYRFIGLWVTSIFLILLIGGSYITYISIFELYENWVIYFIVSSYVTLFSLWVTIDVFKTSISISVFNTSFVDIILHMFNICITVNDRWNYDKIEKWCKDNCHDRYIVFKNYLNDETGIAFKSVDDAMRFKMEN